MKTSQTFGILFAIALILFGALYPIPAKHLNTNSYSYKSKWTESYGEEYVGGDAYNYQMEASLKAGYMSGVMAMKSISVASGILLFFITLYSHVKCEAIEAQTEALTSIIGKINKQEDSGKEKADNSGNQPEASGTAPETPSGEAQKAET